MPALSERRLPRPATAVGVVRSERVPSPSWPWPLWPQQRTPAVRSRAQVWRLPPLTLSTFARPVTATGAALFLVVDPENLPAWRLYDRRGFEGTRWLLMAKRL